MATQIHRDSSSFRTNKLNNKNLKSQFYEEELAPDSSGFLKHLLNHFPKDVTFPMFSLYFTTHLSAHSVNFTDTDF